MGQAKVLSIQHNGDHEDLRASIDAALQSPAVRAAIAEALKDVPGVTLSDATSSDPATTAIRPTAKVDAVRFMVIHFTGDERAVHHAVVAALGNLPGVQFVDAHTSGRDPRPPVPAESAEHAASLRSAGHHAAADHLEAVAGEHARAREELDLASEYLIRTMPADVCVPGRPLHEHAQIHHAESKHARTHAANAVELVRAVGQAEALIDHRPETTKKELRELFRGARKKAEARATRVESARQRQADFDAESDKSARQRLEEWDAWRKSGLSLEEWDAWRKSGLSRAEWDDWKKSGLSLAEWEKQKSTVPILPSGAPSPKLLS